MGESRICFSLFLFKILGDVVKGMINKYLSC